MTHDYLAYTDKTDKKQSAVRRKRRSQLIGHLRRLGQDNDSTTFGPISKDASTDQHAGDRNGAIQLALMAGSHSSQPVPAPPWLDWAKRMFDVVSAISAIVMLSPLLLGIAIAIRVTSRGPALFVQIRTGKDGVPFGILKFRTMYLDDCDQSGIAQTASNDPRVTAVGRFLRGSNFDELPQLFNVLAGEMSLVGPRPHVPGMLAAGRPYEEFDARYGDRHQVRPGITGLAQVNGFRGETRDPYAALMRLEYDLEYIRQRSLWLDIKIIAGTIAREFFKGNGY